MLSLTSHIRKSDFALGRENKHMARTTKVEHAELIGNFNMLPFLDSKISGRHLDHANPGDLDVDQRTAGGEGDERLRAGYGTVGRAGGRQLALS